MYLWCTSLKKESSMAEKIVRKLNNEQYIDLYKLSKFKVSTEIKSDICKFCSLDKENCIECSLRNGTNVDGRILREVRFYALNYLNMLETVMAAWYLSIVDKKIIEEEFSFLIAEGKGQALYNFRHSAGGYTLIEKFIDKIKENKDPPKKEDL